MYINSIHIYRYVRTVTTWYVVPFIVQTQPSFATIYWYLAGDYRRQHSRQPANHHRAFYSICTDKRTQVRVLLHVGGTQRFHGGGYAYVCIYCCCVWFALATATNIIDCSDHEDCFLLRNRCGLCYGLCPFGQACFQVSQEFQSTASWLR